MLENLDLLIDDEGIWFSSIDLCNISGRRHDNVVRDINRDIIELFSNCGIHMDEFLKFEELKRILETKKKELNQTSHIDDMLLNISIKIEYRKTPTGKYPFYLLNREAALMCMMRYSPVVRMVVSNLFFKSSDMLKSKGYKIGSTKDMYMSIDEEINNSIETLEEDLKEGEKLSQFNMWHLFFLLLNKIPPVLTKYFMKEFPSFDYMKEMAERFGDFTSPNFIDPDKKRL